MTVKSALHYHRVKFASNYDLNVYRGCEHRCRYCFAQYSQKYLESDFFEDIGVETNNSWHIFFQLDRTIFVCYSRVFRIICP